MLERLAKLEAVLPLIQKQLDENSKQLIDVQKDLARLNEKMNLVVWLGSGIGVVLLGVAGKLFFEPKTVAVDPSDKALREMLQRQYETELKRLDDRLNRLLDSRPEASSTPGGMSEKRT